MKKIILSLFIILFSGIIFFPSCKKEKSCEGCINGNQPPTAVAGPNQVITLPTDSISLDGSSSSDPDGTISEWLWKKISGPASFNIVNSASAKSIVRNLDTGVYRFELKVTDNETLSATDTVQITVTDPGQPNRPPIANAGMDQTITLPANTVTLNASASTDPDNNISSYLWTKISGPSSFNITNANAAQSQVINLVAGVYQFELKVTDAGALFSKDTMRVTVNTQPPPPLPQICDSNRPQINAQLIPVGNLSQPRVNMSVASAGNKILFAGGYPAPGQRTSRVDIYDLSSQSWSTAELGIARWSIAAVASGNKIFFGGGLSDTGVTDGVDIYDVSVNTWTVDHLSLPGENIAAAAVGGKVFFAGGFYDDPDRGNRVDIYDMNTQTWSTSVLSQRREYITPVTANNKIYFSGGVTPDDVFPGFISDRIDIYDYVTNSWSVSSLVEPKCFHAGIAAVGKIYWAGGNHTSCAVEIRDAITGNSSIQYLSTQGNWYFNYGRDAVVKGNKIVFFGHYLWNGQNVKFDIYDISTNTWSIGVIPMYIQAPSVISVNNTIYLAGGVVNGVLSNQVWKLEF